jgi:protein-L-isoaspartate(D-aspartate) O-methyltransferase
MRPIGFEPDTGYQFWVLGRDGSWACLQPEEAQVEQHGKRRLWDEVEHAHQRWLAWGQPTRDRFGVTVLADGRHRVWLDDPNRLVADL